MNTSINVYAIHGFLGIPSDWNVILPHFPQLNMTTLDAFKIAPPEKGFKGWAEALNRLVEETQSGYRVLLGYSMGGRLALHTLLQKPHLWNAALFLSTHSGLQDPLKKEMRIKNDLDWSKKFASEAWESLMQQWNSQRVFESSFEPKREERNYSRSQLSSALLHWSLGKQEYLWPELIKQNIPTLWLTGKNDPSSPNEELDVNNVNMRNLPQAGHRILWDQPKQVSEKINQFLKENLQP